ncbi:MAG: hypothetical protein ABL958_12960 [Bdellovibrionia bacterium]
MNSELKVSLNIEAHDGAPEWSARALEGSARRFLSAHKNVSLAESRDQPDLNLHGSITSEEFRLEATGPGGASISKVSLKINDGVNVEDLRHAVFRAIKPALRREIASVEPEPAAVQAGFPLLGAGAAFVVLALLALSMRHYERRAAAVGRMARRHRSKLVVAAVFTLLAVSSIFVIQSLSYRGTYERHIQEMKILIDRQRAAQGSNNAGL